MPIIVGTVLLVIAGAVYIGSRWRRAPQTYRAMFVVAVGYLLAGIVLGGSIVGREMLPSSNDVAKALGTDVATKGPER